MSALRYTEVVPHLVEQSRSPLPIETDGVESNGAVINSQSWIKPSNTPISGTSQNYDYSGPCTIDVTQSGWGIPAQYEAWVRDASNAAIGGLSATMIGATVSFPAGGQDMSIGVVPAPYPNMSAKVVMTWGKAVSMAYNPATSMDSQGCAFAGNTPGSVTYFQCSFDCTPLGKS